MWRGAHAFRSRATGIRCNRPRPAVVSAALSRPPDWSADCSPDGDGEVMAASQEDFATFYDATWRRTVACAYAVLGELGAAEEAAQEAYTRAWPRWSTISTYDDPGAWVRQVATRQAISGWRRRRTARKNLGNPRPDSSPAPDENT